MTMEKVGLIAGNGKLPELFLNQCILKGIEPFSVYLFESVEDSVKEHKNSVKYSVAQVGKIISYFKKKLKLEEALQTVEREYGQYEEAQNLINFIRKSKRGITR